MPRASPPIKMPHQLPDSRDPLPRLWILDVTESAAKVSVRRDDRRQHTTPQRRLQPRGNEDRR